MEAILHLQIKPYLDETSEEILANPQYGDGGMPQYFVKNIEIEIGNGTLVRGTSYPLNNSEISNINYYKMVNEAKMKNTGGLG